MEVRVLPAQPEEDAKNGGHICSPGYRSVRFPRRHYWYGHGGYPAFGYDTYHTAFSQELYYYEQQMGITHPGFARLAKALE